MREKPDHYTLQAKKEGYPARSVYKLKEIQEKFNLIEKGDSILDIGCAPGSWSLYAAETTGKDGYVLGLDLQEPNPGRILGNLDLKQGDVFEYDFSQLQPFDLIISDAAPKTTGNRTVDTAKSLGLNEGILYLSTTILKSGGKLVMKIFQGGGEQELLKTMRRVFNQVKIFKPKAVRKISFEIYFIGIGKKEEIPSDLY
jgi:23S rRNA (uridine2552-2'-O)-methyltransferase